MSVRWSAFIWGPAKKVEIKVVSLSNFRPDFRPVNEGGQRKKGEAGMKEGRKEGRGRRRI